MRVLELVLCSVVIRLPNACIRDRPVQCCAIRLPTAFIGASMVSFRNAGYFLLRLLELV